MDKKDTFAAAVIVLPAFGALFNLLIGVVVLFVLGLLLLSTKNITKKTFALAIIVFFVFAELYFLYFQPALIIARNQGTVLSDNWYQALTWIKENTPECTVVATYWDPGHFITGISRRAVVFDGASQGDLFSRPAVYNEDGVKVEQHDSNINHIVMYSNGNKTTARIQDISTTLLTTNETLAINILREYRKSGCDSMYYIASSDLISKSTWWSYFATWNPVDKRGTPYVYSTIGLASARPDIRQNAIIYTYPISQQESFVVYVTNSTVVAFLQQQGVAEPLKIRNFVYFGQDGFGQIFTQNDAVIDGTLWIEPGNGAVLFIPPQLERSLFTRMFLYNGNGLEHFEFVNNWGGEVKLYKVNFNGT